MPEGIELRTIVTLPRQPPAARPIIQLITPITRSTEDQYIPSGFISCAERVLPLISALSTSCALIGTFIIFAALTLPQEQGSIASSALSNAIQITEIAEEIFAGTIGVSCVAAGMEALRAGTLLGCDAAQKEFYRAWSREGVICKSIVSICILCMSETP